MLHPTLKNTPRPRTPQYHDATTITHEHVPEIFSPEYMHTISQPVHTTYYRPSHLGLSVEGDGFLFPQPMDTAAQPEPRDAPPLPRTQIGGYTIEGGWQSDGLGGLRYQDYGKIEEVSNLGYQINSHSTGNTITPGDYEGPIIITKPLPSTATPPPAPNFRARRIEIPELGFVASAPGLNWRATPYSRHSSVKSSRVGSPPVQQGPSPSNMPNINPSLPQAPSRHPLYDRSLNHSQVGNQHVGQHAFSSRNSPPPHDTTPSLPATQSPVRERPTHPPPMSPPPRPSPRNLDEHNEPSVLNSNLRLIETALRNIDGLNSIFQHSRMLEDIRPQLGVDMCGRMKATVSALNLTLNRRTRFSQEYWQLRTQKWHGRYTDRLLSLRRTLQRLASFEERMNESQPGPKAINKALEKLRQFELKLSDLNSAFNRLFDRLRTRQLHAMLTESISGDERMQRSDFPTREAYKTRLMEGKATRARLRRDFFVYRTGRRLSLVT